ncbi:alpha-1,3-mannosyl-glycoprotein 4-beta-N-acetylglucosaminyltransferase C-like [Corythoichthys intestinalis]|uniref:alpha-1,3-mannosyl-glycoprotein 4-beta-N-acetylglucosaminyltransferase C-like n=1 Tax=Corythoichthys intestinalis TaxID=161448 RepID=UPI0025A654A2|nr:alpha-1,3-mannosyl-glycoprotein 4-beta-N-acetylglucosaminyltransferase C-like [Corythoichthys intestinalis]XP_061803664.1 alpha-1,3-mannosyl-glycoprotein 4-beta-N-acetylglucosaminyltransferase C-like [Nerophis lumbriciformis]
MRLHSKKRVVLLLLFLLGGIYIVRRSDSNNNDLIKSKEPVLMNVEQKAERTANTEPWLQQGLPFNVTYQVLAGVPFTQSRYLCIGLSSIKRKKDNYLIATLVSLFSQSSPQEHSSMVVVVLLADLDVSWRMKMVTKIKSEFSSMLQQGHLLVIHVPEDCYPPTKGLKRNYNDSPERVSYRSKQNLDYAFLVHFSTRLGKYYLQLEDDVSAAKNFPTTIKNYVEMQEAKKKSWAMLEFSSLGYIGKLYNSAHLPLLARFLFLFYQEMPCDWLMSHFRVLLTQKEPIHFKPSLFQHMGFFSSFQGTRNHLKDQDFEESVYSNPPAEVFSNMSPYKDHVPQLAWEAGRGFFWGRTPKKGNYLTVVFTNPDLVTGITVETGLDGKDTLASAQVEIGHGVISTAKEKTCRDFILLGSLENGRFVKHELDKLNASASSCLKIQVTAEQKGWVIIRKIRISTKPSSFTQHALM